MEKKFFNFIKSKTPSLIQVLEVKLKDTDDENGFINEHYIVECLLQVPDTNVPIMNFYSRTKKTCLVSVVEFNNWLKREEGIKWI